MIFEQQTHLGTHRRHTRLVGRTLGVLALTFYALAMAPQSYAADPLEQQHLVDKARLTLEAFAADPSLGDPIRELKSETKALFIVPQVVRGAFVFGGAGGSGVLLVRDEKTGAWSEPAFYTMGSASFGLQIGGDVSEMVFVVRTQKGLEGFYRTDFKLGADVSMAVGPVGGGVSVRGLTADLVSYARKKGIFAGFSAEGAVLAVSDDSNRAYYGQEVRPTDIVVKRSVSNPKSADLRSVAAKIMK
jgi:SH3 domain-containing YSC84-like protein 1